MRTNLKLTQRQADLAALVQARSTAKPVPSRPNNQEAHNKNPNLRLYFNHYGAVYNPTVCLCAWCGGVNQIGNPDPNAPRNPGYGNWITDKDEAYQIYLLHAGYYAGTVCPNVLDPATFRVPHRVAGFDTFHGKCDCACSHQWEQCDVLGYRGSRCKLCNAEFINPDSSD